MYPIETKLAPKQSWFTPVEAKNYYGKYSRDGITIHWWGGGEPASAHDSIVNYFLQQGAAGVKSVNYVVSDIKITKMVEPDNVAWASQSGNAVSVSIEFQPTLSAEGYKRGGWLINELEKKYDKALTLWPHNHWFSTACPGTIDLNRLRSEANKFKEAPVNNEKPYNDGDEVNVAKDTGHTLQELQNKLNWNDAYYAVIGPELRARAKIITDLKAQIAGMGQPIVVKAGDIVKFV